MINPYESPVTVSEYNTRWLMPFIVLAICFVFLAWYAYEIKMENNVLHDNNAKLHNYNADLEKIVRE